LTSADEYSYSANQTIYFHNKKGTLILLYVIAILS